MEYMPIEKLLDKADNSMYKLVMLAAKRTLELVEGQPNLVSGNSSLKPSNVALEEIAKGKVKLIHRIIRFI
jgi:DNA-directed RNA polymerase omega subunit